MTKREFYVYSNETDPNNDIFIDWETLERAINGKNYLHPLADEFYYIGDFYSVEQAEQSYYTEKALAAMERLTHP